MGLYKPDFLHKIKGKMSYYINMSNLKKNFMEIVTKLAFSLTLDYFQKWSKLAWNAAIETLSLARSETRSQHHRKYGLTWKIVSKPHLML